MKPPEFLPIIRKIDDKGRVFDRFTAQRFCLATGWIVQGRNPEYNDALVMICAYRKARTVKTWKGRYMGFATKREAQAIADRMNAGEL